MKNYEMSDVTERSESFYDFEFYCYEYGTIVYRDIYVHAFGTPERVSYCINFNNGEPDYFIMDTDFPADAFDEEIETTSGVWPAFLWELIARKIIEM